MNRRLLPALLGCAISAFGQTAQLCHSPGSIAPNQTSQFIGSEQEKTVCGRVVGVHQTQKVTFINFGHAYPHQDFTIVIWDADRKNVGSIPQDGACVCVTGLITQYKSKPQIVLKDATKMTIQHPLK